MPMPWAPVELAGAASGRSVTIGLLPRGRLENAPLVTSVRESVEELGPDRDRDRTHVGFLAAARFWRRY